MTAPQTDPRSADQIIKIAHAVHFAALKHSAQSRKGEAAEPYFNHLAEVAGMLAIHTDATDTNLIIAGYLHDTLEDTKTTYEELSTNFGQDVADLVKEVTDDKTLPKAERKRLQIQNASHKSARAKMLKIADKISNLHSILNSPPKDWSPERKREYFNWAKQVVAGCKGANPAMEATFENTYSKGQELLG